MYHANMNVILIVKNVTGIKNGTLISVGVSVKTQKNIVCLRKYIFGILQHEVAEMVNM